MVSRAFFDVLGVGPARGRAFVAEEQQPGGPGAVIVSHGFWQRELGGRADVLDRTLRLGSEAYRIVGVMPPQFDFPRGAALWTPAEREERVPSRTAHNWDVVARVSGDVPLATGAGRTVRHRQAHEGAARRRHVDVRRGGHPAP